MQPLLEVGVTAEQIRKLHRKEEHHDGRDYQAHKGECIASHIVEFFRIDSGNLRRKKSRLAAANCRLSPWFFYDQGRRSALAGLLARELSSKSPPQQQGQ